MTRDRGRCNFTLRLLCPPDQGPWEGSSVGRVARRSPHWLSFGLGISQSLNQRQGHCTPAPQEAWVLRAEQTLPDATAHMGDNQGHLSGPLSKGLRLVLGPCPFGETDPESMGRL